MNGLIGAGVRGNILQAPKSGNAYDSYEQDDQIFSCCHKFCFKVLRCFGVRRPTPDKVTHDLNKLIKHLNNNWL